MNTNRYIYIITSTFYRDLSDELVSGAIDYLVKKLHGHLRDDQMKQEIFRLIEVPGAFEIPSMVKQILNNKSPDYRPSLIITLGVIIKGETNHFEQISEFVFESISKLTMSSDVPISFGVISALDYKQAEERALVSKRNKGAEVASAGLKMLELYDQYKK